MPQTFADLIAASTHGEINEIASKEMAEKKRNGTLKSPPANPSTWTT